MIKLKKYLISGLIVVGIILSLQNFIPRLQADSISGTTINMTDPQMLYYYQCVYGPEYMNSHWLYDLYYCLEEPFNCMIVV